VIDLYGRYRLLTFDRDPSSRVPTVEVAHEALIHSWSRLRAWIDASREDVRVQRRLGIAAVSGLPPGTTLVFSRPGHGWHSSRRWPLPAIWR